MRSEDNRYYQTNEKSLVFFYIRGELMTQHQRSKWQQRIKESKKRKLIRTLNKHKRLKNTY